MGGVFSSKANTAAQHSGSKRPRDDAPAPQKLQSLRAEKRAERGAVLLTPWGQALTKAADALRRWHRDDDGADPQADVHQQDDALVFEDPGRVPSRKLAPRRSTRTEATRRPEIV